MRTITLQPGDVTVDYSGARPDLEQLKSHGVKAVSRYLGGGLWKRLSRDEITNLFGAGLGLMLNFEAGAGNMKLGAAQGYTDGAECAAELAWLGLPSDARVWVSCDVNTTAAEFPACCQYMAAFQARCPQAKSFYGETALGDALAAAGFVDQVWETASTSWPQGTQDRVVLKQQLDRVNTGDLPWAMDEDIVTKPFEVYSVFGDPLPAPIPEPITRGTMYSPPLHPIVSSCPGPGGVGALAVAADGSFYNLHAPLVSKPGDVLGPNGQTYWGSRQAARVDLNADGTWTITATSGEAYTYPHPAA